MEILKVVEEELRKGYAASSQLRGLLFPLKCDSEKKKKEQLSQLDDERVRACMDTYSTTIINAFDTCISILKDVSSCKITKRCHKTRVRKIETSHLTPDGYAWRKYGQKSILHRKHPREYYRCAYREDRQCQATKHVQKILDNPTKYMISYYSDHTCRSILNYNNAFHSYGRDFAYNLISFESKVPSPLPKQDLNLELLHASISDNPIIQDEDEVSTMRLPHNDECPSNCIADDPPMTNVLQSSKITESSLGDHIVCLNEEADVVFSPRIIMSPCYMGSYSYAAIEDCILTEEDQFFDIGGIVQDLPFWE